MHAAVVFSALSTKVSCTCNCSSNCFWAVRAFAGQNAAGKSTLINCLSGLLAPTHGEAFLFGNSIREDVAILRDRMGTCPQHVRGPGVVL